jgi:cellulose synthase/poly-beta-1,6-N-acetylglucosamine synthase-like glycosyltransferase
LGYLSTVTSLVYLFKSKTTIYNTTFTTLVVLMRSPTLKIIQPILLRILNVILILSLACLWVMLTATPAWAQANTINYSNTNLENRDFSNADLVGGVLWQQRCDEQTFKELT